ncbi:SDR family oxidoreductase [soil metagenome]
MSRDLSGLVVAVLGGNGGLGTPISAALERRGATVVAVSRTSDPSIDIRDADAGDRIVALVTEHHGRLDGVVNATGIVAFGNLVDTDDVVIEELFLTNVLGPLWLIKRVAPALSETKGFVVNISGVVAETPTAGMAAYSASKAALAASGAALHRELRRLGVQVIDVRPPHTETGLATRPLAGTAPKMPAGLDPAVVAERIVAAIEAGDHDVASSEFG